MKTLIVGGVAGGASAAARLRRLSEDMEIVLVERGRYTSYANCGLPYYIGNEIKEQADLIVQPTQALRDDFNLDIRTETEAYALDAKSKQIWLRNMKTGETYAETYDKLVLSPGAKPIVPPFEGSKLERVYTLRDVPDAVQIRSYLENHAPKSVVVCGAGYIGVELAENLVNQGLKVTLVDMASHVIPPLDAEIAQSVQIQLKAHGVTLKLNSGVRGIKQAGEGLSVQLDGEAIEADMVFLCIGVRPDTDWLKDSGLKMNDRGAILTDDSMRTSDENIYAVGDAVLVTDFVTKQPAFIPLAGPANKQGRIAADNIVGRNSRYKGTQGSSVLKVFDYTCATTGISEEKAKQMGIDCDKVFLRKPNHATYYPGASNVLIKLIFKSATGRILGAQVFGKEGTDKRCDVLATAIRAGMTGEDLAELELCYAPPYGSAKDPVNMCGYLVENVRSGLVKQIHWNEIDAVVQAGKGRFIDVRAKAMYDNGHIPGFDNFPLKDLRKASENWSKDEPIYIHCTTGHTSYNAYRFLENLGFTCFNVAGGFMLYNEMKNL